MKIERLEGPPFEKVQCELPKEDLREIGWKGYRERRAAGSGANPSTCMQHARWKVDGMQLCTQHAGMKVLEELAE